MFRSPYLLSTRLCGKRRLGWLAGVALLSSPVLAEEIAQPVVEFVESESDSVSEAMSTVVTAAEPVDRTAMHCSNVSLADSPMISPAAPPPASKASAILGGEISSLDRIRLAQSGMAMPSIAPLQAVPAIFADLRNTDTNQQEMAAYAPRLDMCHDRLRLPSAPLVRPDDRMILGSLRLSIRKTPFDHKWGKVTQAGSARALKRWWMRTGASGAVEPRTQLAAINSWVNAKIAYTDDIALYRQNDFWASSLETLRRGKGDCEDYAILKMDLLAAMGIQRDKMILVIARDLVRNADHAVLVVQLEDGPVVLDNATDQLLDGRLPNDYRPIMSFASNGKWLHGYAVAVAEQQLEPPTTAPAVTIAALSVPLVPVTVLSAPVLASN